LKEIKKSITNQMHSLAFSL